MTFRQKIGYFLRLAISVVSPKQRYLFLRHYSILALPSDLIPTAENCWYRVLKKGIVRKEASINLEEESEKLLKQSEDALPLVSCLLVTKNRFQLAKKSVECFMRQSYPNRELIVIDDGEDRQLKDWVEGLKNSKIRFFHLPDKSKKLGVLRNLSREKARGEFVAQWDDDDLSHYNRLLFQMTLIQKMNLDGCTLQREELWFPTKQRFGYSARRLWEGSMICNNKKLPLYHETRRGEESDAVNQLSLNGKIALLDFPQLYTYCFHGKNTFDEPHFEQIWEVASVKFSEKEYEERKNNIFK
ncbi:MAG: glycosyltransferase [Chitinophagales bacterium]